MSICFFALLCFRIAALTGGGSRASKRSLVVRIMLSGPVPCSGARRRGKALDEVSAAILGDAVAENDKVTGAQLFAHPVKRFVGGLFSHITFLALCQRRLAMR